MRRAFIVLASCIALAACERSFDISKEVGESTVWMSFIPSNDYDTTFFILQATTPLVGVAEPVLTRDESVEVKVNGQPLSLEKNERSIPDRQQFYATDHVFAPGDRVEAVATVPGTGTVSASCEVPQPFPTYTWTISRVPRPSSSVSFTMYVDIDYTDPGDGGYYGVVLMQYWECESQWEDRDPETGEKYWGEITHEEHTGALTPWAMSDSEALSASAEEPVTVMPRYFNYLNTRTDNQRRVQIWSDKPGSAPAGSTRRITFASRCNESPAHVDYDRGEYHGWADYRYKYRLVLYRFSESYYNYLKARYNSSYGDFAEMGLSPASFVYTNVKGGAGVCGAYTVLSSDWVTLPPAE
jgi:hypothetical protein